MARAVTAMRNALASADAAYRRARPHRAAVLPVLEPLATGRRGFEVGGPSEIFSPSGPLFSGWNCVPMTLRRAEAAAGESSLEAMA